MTAPFLENYVFLESFRVCWINGIINFTADYELGIRLDETLS